jgi:hypothetical protein
VNASWSVEQREWLQALGYDLLVPASQAPVVDTTLPVAKGGERGAPADAAPLAAAGRGADEAVEPLLRALLRAARTDAPDEVRAIAGDLARLRADPAAKRALWLQLRALRRRRRR